MNKIIGGIAVVALILGVLGFSKNQNIVVGPTGERGIQGVKGDKGDKGDRGPQGEMGLQGPRGTSTLGAVSGPDSFFPCESHDGVKRCFTKKALSTATTTVCSIKTTATSTLVSGGAMFTTSSSTASVVVLSKGALATASTTQIGTNFAIAANAQGTLFASTTALVFSPGDWFNVTMSGGTGTFSPTGYCQATFETF